MNDAIGDAFLARWQRSPLRGVGARAEDALAIFAWLRQGHALVSGEGAAADVSELEINLGMLAARLVPSAMRMADLAAVIAAARDTLGQSPDASPHYWDWIASLLGESALQNAVAGIREHHAELVAQASPIVMLTAELPALIAVANPTNAGIEAACARLLLMIVRVGARHAIVELSFCAEASRAAFVPYLTRLAAHPSARRTQLLVVGAGRENQGHVAAGVKVVWLEEFGQALQSALA